MSTLNLIFYFYLYSTQYSDRKHKKIKYLGIISKTIQINIKILINITTRFDNLIKSNTQLNVVNDL